MTVLTASSTVLTSKALSTRAVQVTGLYLTSKPLIHAPRLACSISRRGLDRNFSTTSTNHLQPKQWFPPPQDSKIEYAPAAWKHPVYTEEQMNNIKIAHRDAKTWQDKLAMRLMRTARFFMDKATGYTENSAHVDENGKLTKKGWLVMDERKWLTRIVFLESIAGVPGMVAAMLRHLHSLRRLRRDNGWIETLLEEAYNERMHLLTFLKLAEPGWFMKVMILGAQGVFFNGFLLSYLLSPRTCHRFVGYLEEEAVYTYSRIIKELDAGNLPAWKDPNYKIPDIAINYWKMPEGHHTMRDLLLYVRADEAKHREVNHTLGNLDQEADPNPFISVYKDGKKDHPGKGIDNLKPTGWERNEVV